MSIVSPSHFPMTSSNLLHPIVHDGSSLKRKRYLEDLEILEENKRARTAPPSPPLATVFKRRSLSPTPPSLSLTSTLSALNVKQDVISPTTSSDPTTYSSIATVLPTITPLELPTIPSTASTISQRDSITTLPSIDKTIPNFKYLNRINRIGTSFHSLNYPDTCVNDEDWRLNLEIWIEKNFPEKFNVLKNSLRHDKPGFDLLNDAILLSELKEKFDNEKRNRKPSFNSKISKKMVTQKKYGVSRRNSDVGTSFYQQSLNSHSDHHHQQQQQQYSYSQQQNKGTNPWYNSSSPITQDLQINTNVRFPYEANYTYTSNETSQHSYNDDPQQHPPSSPIASKEFSSSSSSASSSFIDNSPHVIPSSTKSSQQTSPTWNGHHKLNQQVVVNTNTFIHTQNHKGPNHTYTIHHHNQQKRRCISCGSDQSPCWRPSWSTSAGQLCNSCGLRYKKTGARCTVKSCGRIPAKGEWTAMKSRGKVQLKSENGEGLHMGYSCLHCGGEVEVKDKSK